MDLEVANDHDISEQNDVLFQLQSDLEKLRLPITIFTTSEAAQMFQAGLYKLKCSGNEIGCHGWDHSITENYQKMNTETLCLKISQSTSCIEEITSVKPVSFRGPGMSTSAETQRILIENGYVSDYSVCSQRIDMFNSIGWNYRWLASPRVAYHPSGRNPYKKGNLPIWVVPLSCLGLPFISGSLFLFGPAFMRSFANILIKESARSGKPIVYLFHSYEFCNRSLTREKSGLKNMEGEKTIHKLYSNDRKKRYSDNLQLLKYLINQEDVIPFTAKSFAVHLNNFEQ